MGVTEGTGREVVGDMGVGRKGETEVHGSLEKWGF